METTESIAGGRTTPQSSSCAEAVLAVVRARNPDQREFHQAVSEVARSLGPVVDRHPRYRTERILERLVEPERVVSFRVVWVDDHGEIQVNRGRLSSKPEGIVKEPLGPGDARLYESPGHQRDWLNCVRARKRPISQCN